MSNLATLKDGDVIAIALNPKTAPELASCEGVEYLSKYCDYIQKAFPNNQVIGVPHFIDIRVIKKEKKIQFSDGDRFEDLPF